MTVCSRCSFVLAAIGFLSGTVSAATLTITPGAIYRDTDAPCSNPNGGWPSCGSNAFVSGTVATDNTVFMNQGTFGSNIPDTGQPLDFSGAFNIWNNNNGNQWTLVNGGDLNVTLNVAAFTAFAVSNVGGIGPNTTKATGIDVTVAMNGGYTGPTLNQLFWVQGLLVNYQPGLPGNGSYNTANTFQTLDEAGFDNIGGCSNLATPGPNNNTPSNVGAGTFCGPLYPFQYAGKDLYDAPLGPYPNASFRAEALLATATIVTDGAGAVTARNLTVYDGVSYGFDVFVTPEPATWALLFGGLAILARIRIRK